MCGRYSNNKAIKEIEENLGFIISPRARNWKPSFNIAPGQEAPVVTLENPRLIDLFHFGLVPFWAKDVKVGYKMINARAETLMERQSFKPLLTRGKRCLVFADSFFEWKREGKEKQPYRIKLNDRDLFAFAGLWSKWTDPEGHDYFSFAIITTEPNSKVKQLHDRMPVVLSREEEGIWMDPESKPEELISLLNPYPGDRVEMYKVSKELNKPSNNFPELLEPQGEFKAIGFHRVFS